MDFPLRSSETAGALPQAPSVEVEPAGDTALQGACLYVPATHERLGAVLAGAVPRGLGAVVVCLEDSVSEAEVGSALCRVRSLMAGMTPSGALRVYVRPRNPAMLEEILGWTEAQHWRGFVLPKFDTRSAPRWLALLELYNTKVMPVLESAEVFCPFAMRDLTDLFVELRSRQRLDAVRIGAADLFRVLGIRRPLRGTIYDTVLGGSLTKVACLLMSRGIPVTAPVCERLEPTSDDVREVVRDVEGGFVGKTAVNFKQVALINAIFAVSPEELRQARLLLDAELAVFRDGDFMCETVPHRNWAMRVISRHARFGVRAESWAEFSPGSAEGEETGDP